MSWNTFHSRGETLRNVVSLANERRDGVLPTSVPGVAEHFHDELDLIGALLLKWHARLSGNIERALMFEPMDLETGVATAWQATAEQMPGVRLIIDRYTDSPDSAEMATSMTRAREREWARLATAAGLASRPDATAVPVGRRVEERARLQLAATDAAPMGAAPAPAPAPGPASGAEPRVDSGVQQGAEKVVSLVDRIKAVLAA